MSDDINYCCPRCSFVVPDDSAEENKVGICDNSKSPMHELAVGSEDSCQKFKLNMETFEDEDDE